MISTTTKIVKGKVLKMLKLRISKTVDFIFTRVSRANKVEYGFKIQVLPFENENDNKSIG